jgi:hypothetical protein
VRRPLLHPCSGRRCRPRQCLRSPPKETRWMRALHSQSRDSSPSSAHRFCVAHGEAGRSMARARSSNKRACVFRKVRGVVRFIAQHGQYPTTISSLLIIVDIVKSVSMRSRILHHSYWLGKRSGNLRVTLVSTGGASSNQVTNLHWLALDRGNTTL